MNPAPSLSVLAPLYKAITDNQSIVDLLGEWNSGPAVFTRRPTPADAPYPMIVVGPEIARSDNDGISQYRPLVTIDVIVYGQQKQDYRRVIEASELVRTLFHRQRHSLIVDNHTVASIRCSGPIPAPVDDDSEVGRAVTLTIQLAAA